MILPRDNFQPMRGNPESQHERRTCNHLSHNELLGIPGLPRLMQSSFRWSKISLDRLIPDVLGTPCGHHDTENDHGQKVEIRTPRPNFSARHTCGTPDFM